MMAKRLTYNGFELPDDYFTHPDVISGRGNGFEDEIPDRDRITQEVRDIGAVIGLERRSGADPQALSAIEEYMENSLRLEGIFEEQSDYLSSHNDIAQYIEMTVDKELPSDDPTLRSDEARHLRLIEREERSLLLYVIARAKEVSTPKELDTVMKQLHTLTEDQRRKIETIKRQTELLPQLEQMTDPNTNNNHIPWPVQQLAKRVLGAGGRVMGDSQSQYGIAA